MPFCQRLDELCGLGFSINFTGVVSSDKRTVSRVAVVKISVVIYIYSNPFLFLRRGSFKTLRDHNCSSSKVLSTLVTRFRARGAPGDAILVLDSCCVGQIVCIFCVCQGLDHQ